MSYYIVVINLLCACTDTMLQALQRRCETYAFDHRGQSGLARGEDAGCVVIKPLDAAIRDNDAIRAMIMSTGINRDGRTKGITVPMHEASHQQGLPKSRSGSFGLRTCRNA